MRRAIWALPAIFLTSYCSLRDLDYLRDPDCAPSCGADAAPGAPDTGAPALPAEAGGPPPAPTCGGRDAGYRDQVLCDAPLAYFRLGERGTGAARDEADGGPLGDYVAPSDGGITYGVPGAIAGDPDTAIHLDGTAWMSAGDVLGFPGQAPYSLEVWVAPEGDNFSYRRILERATIANGNIADGYIVYNHDVCAGERFVDGGSVPVIGAALANLVYSHVVVSFDGTTQRIYVNGAATSAKSAGLPLAPAQAIFYVGGDGTGLVDGWIGRIDEVAVYDHALTPERIAQHYRTGRGP